MSRAATTTTENGHETTVEMRRPGWFQARCSCGWVHERNGKPRLLPDYLAAIEAYAHRNPGWRK